jgi:chromate transporter
MALYLNRLCDGRWIVYGDSLRGPDHRIEAALALEAPDGGWFFIIVLAFVGSMAGYNHFHRSLWMGTLGLLATTFYTSLPCFLFVFAGAPLVKMTEGKPVIKGVLGLITAVVVGALLELTLFLEKGVLFPSGIATVRSLDAISAAWVILSLVLLTRGKMNIAYLVLLSVVFGVVRYEFGLH